MFHHATGNINLQSVGNGMHKDLLLEINISHSIVNENNLSLSMLQVFHFPKGCFIDEYELKVCRINIFNIYNKYY
jgi:hypothetical protein